MFCEKTEKVTTVTLTEVQPKNAGFSKFIVSKDIRLLYMGDWEQPIFYNSYHICNPLPLQGDHRNVHVRGQWSMPQQTFCHASFHLVSC